MELFSSTRWRLYRPKRKAVVFMSNPKKYAFHSCLTAGPIQLFISFYQGAPRSMLTCAKSWSQCSAYWPFKAHQKMQKRGFKKLDVIKFNQTKRDQSRTRKGLWRDIVGICSYIRITLKRRSFYIIWRLMQRRGKFPVSFNQTRKDYLVICMKLCNWIQTSKTLGKLDSENHRYG